MRWISGLLLAAALWGQGKAEFEGLLKAEAEKHWAAREQRLAGLDSRAAIANWQKEIRATALELVGGLPKEKSPLKARVTGVLTRPGYRVEKVAFESQPGFVVTANLYLPADRPGPFPVVLGVAGHSATGKAIAIYQRAFLGFVKRGIAVLAYDPPGQGERLEYYDAPSGKSRAGIGVGEHLMTGVPTLLVGQTIARHFVWDGVRAIDYLLTRPEIDGSRIGVAGNSGGGTQAAYLAMFEPRITAVVSSCYMTRWQELWSGPGPQDSEQIWPGLISRGLDFGDFAMALAPRPFLITSAIRDYFPIAGARTTWRQGQRIFDLLGKGDSFGFFEYDDTHGWSQPRREAASRWFDRHFFGKETDGTEPELLTEDESDLWVTPTGQLTTSWGSRTMRDLAVEQAERLAAGRSRVTVDLVKKAVRWEEPVAAAPIRLAPAVKRVVLALEVAEADIKEIESHGVGVVKVTPRGTGPDYPKGGGSGYSAGYQVAARTWLLGRNLLAIQAADIVATVRALQQGVKVAVYAKDSLGPAAMLAAVMEPRIERVLVESSIRSWEELVRAPVQQGWENTIVPGALAHFDLPDLAQLIPSGRYRELAPVNAARNALRGSGILRRGEGWSLERSAGRFLWTDD